MPPLDPTNLADRIAALEDRLSSLQLSDLPVAALQRKLENDWQPDASVLLQPNSVTADQLATGVALLLADPKSDHKVALGSVDLSFSAATDSATATINHGLGATPTVIVIQNTVVFGTRSVVGYIETRSAWTATTFRAFARADAAFTGTSTHTWLAIA